MLTRLESPDFLGNDVAATDTLGRAPLAAELTRLLASSPGPFVLAVDGAWGTGKTTFVQIWRRHLDAAGFATLYFNAWEHDFAEDPLVAFIAEAEAGLKELRNDQARWPRGNSLWRATKEAGTKFLGAAAPAAVQIITHGLISSTATKAVLSRVGEDASESVAERLPELAEEFAKNQIGAYLKQRHAMASFRAALERFATAYMNREEGKMTPIVVFVDELDRCRPSFAISALERMKHLFSVRGVVFVLSVDQVQLAHSLRSVYGQGTRAEVYLRRIIDLHFSLPEPSLAQFVQVSLRRAAYPELAKEDERLAQEFAVFEKYVPALAQLLGFTLRDVERVVVSCGIVYRATPRTQVIDSVMLVTLVVLRLANEDLYARYVRGQAKAGEVIDFLRAGIRAEKVMDKHMGHMIQGALISSAADEAEADGLIGAVTRRDPEVDEQRLAVAQAVLHFRHRDRGTWLRRHTAKQIDFAMSLRTPADD